MYWTDEAPVDVWIGGDEHVELSFARMRRHLIYVNFSLMMLESLSHKYERC